MQKPPNDELKIIRVYQVLGIAYKKETIIALTGDSFVDFMEGPTGPGFIKMLSPSMSGPAIVLQGRSPIEIRVYDSKSRVTGLVNKEVKEEIPESIYDIEHNIAMILSATDVYHYAVIGTDEGGYGLTVGMVEGEQSTTFTATSIPTLANSLHRYSIDWTALSRGEEGVTVEIDEDGDRVPELIITSDGELTQDEYLFVTSVNPEGKLPTTWSEVKRTQLFQNYPNPFNPDTWIPYTLAEQNRVVIKIHNTTGELVRTLDLGSKPVGVYLSKDKAAYWDGRDVSGESVASGVYFYTLRAGDYTATKKMVIAK